MMSRRLKWLVMPLILPLCVILPACAHQNPTPVTDGACVVFPRLTFDRLEDTLDTIVQVKAYDARRDAVCGAGK